MFSPYLGKEYSKDEIVKAFLNFEGKIRVTECADVFLKLLDGFRADRNVGQER